HHFADLRQQHEVYTLGMWIFLATELMVFGGLFAGYAMYRYQYPADFNAGSAHLNLAFGGWNTVVLLTSSLTMALAVFCAQTNRRTGLVWFLIATAALGTVFLIVKAFEYHEDYVENLVPGLAFDPSQWPRPLQPQRVELFLLFYYIMTGLHAVHLI